MGHGKHDIVQATHRKFLYGQKRDNPKKDNAVVSMNVTYGGSLVTLHDHVENIPRLSRLPHVTSLGVFSLSVVYTLPASPNHLTGDIVREFQASKRRAISACDDTKEVNESEL